MVGNGGRSTIRASRISVLVLLALSTVMCVQATSSYSSTEREALRVLSKHKALFTLIPQRVAQILKLVRLHSHAAPVQRLDIVHGAIRHVHGKYRIVNQLRDTVRETRAELSAHLNKGIVQQFTSLEKRLIDYTKTLRATLNVLDSEVTKLLAVPGTASLQAKSGKAHKAAQAVLAPNHIDTLVDTLAGHDRAVDENPEYKGIPRDAGLHEELSELRKDIADVASSVEESISTVTQDFAGVMATMSQMHAQAALERAETLEVVEEQLADVPEIVVTRSYNDDSAHELRERREKEEKEAREKKEKEEKKARKKKKKKAKKEKEAREKAEKEAREKVEKEKKAKDKKDKDKKKEAYNPHEDKTEKAPVEKAIQAELVGDLRTLGYGALHGYKRVKNGVARVARAAYDSVSTGARALKNTIARGIGTAQPALMAVPFIGGHAPTAGTWAMAGSLRTASRLDPTRVLEQPLLPTALTDSYKATVTASAKKINGLYEATKAGVQSLGTGAATIFGGLKSLGTQAISTVGSVGSSAGSVSAAAGRKIVETGSSVLGTTKQSVCSIGRGFSQAACFASEQAQKAAQAVGQSAASGAAQVATTARNAGQYAHNLAGSLTNAVSTGTVTVASGAVAQTRSLGSGLYTASSVTKNVITGTAARTTKIIGQAGGAVLTRVRTELEGLADMSATLMSAVASGFEASLAQVSALTTGLWSVTGDVLDAMIDGMRWCVTTLGQLFSGGASAVKNMGTTLTVYAADATSNGATLTKQGVHCVTNAAGQCVHYMTDGARRLLTTVGTGAMYAKQATFNTAHTVATTAQRGMSLATNTVRSAGTTLSGYMTNGSQSAGSVLRDASSFIGKRAVQAKDSMSAGLKTGAGAVSNLATRGASLVGNGVTTGTRLIKNGVSTGTNVLKNSVGSVAGSVSTLGSSAGSALRNVGSAVGQQAERATSAAFTLGDAVRGYLDAAKSAVEKIMMCIATGFATMRDLFNSGIDSLQTHAIGTTRAVGSHVSRVGQYGMDTARNIKDTTTKGAGSLMKNGMNTVGAVTGSVLSGFRSGVTTVGDVTGSSWQYAKEAVTKGLGVGAHWAQQGLQGTQEVLGSLVQRGGNAVRGIANVGANASSQVTGVARRAAKSGAELSSHAFGTARNALGSVATFSSDALNAARSAVGSGVSASANVLSSVKDTVMHNAHMPVDTAKKAGQWCWQTSEGYIRQVASSVGNGLVAFKSRFVAVVAHAHEMIVDIVHRVTDLVGKSVSSIKKGFAGIMGVTTTSDHSVLR